VVPPLDFLDLGVPEQEAILSTNGTEGIARFLLSASTTAPKK